MTLLGLILIVSLIAFWLISENYPPVSTNRQLTIRGVLVVLTVLVVLFMLNVDLPMLRK